MQGKGRCPVKNLFAALTVALLSACSVWTVDPGELQRGAVDGVTFTTSGRPTYDRVWSAAMKAMSNGMTVVESHKPSGVIRSRVGTEHACKVVALFISPTLPRAPQYSVELVSKRPMGIGQPERQNWEPSVVEDFHAALNAE
jgi:hypothetical protein